MKPNRASITRVSLTLAAAFSVGSGPHLSAASLAWDGSDPVTSGSQGGSGTWDSAITANWWDGAADVAWPNSGSDNDAIFGDSSGTVTLDPAGVTANDITFGTTGYILSGPATLTLDGTTPTFQLASGVSASIGNNTATVLGGTAGLTKTGAGTLTLNGSAAHGVTGGISVKGGTLALAFANLPTPTNLLDSTNSLSMFNGGTLSTTGKNGAFNTAQTFNGTSIYTGNSTLIVNNASGTSSTVTLGTLSQAEVGGTVSIYSTNPAIANPNITSQIFKASNPTLNFIGSWAFVGDSKGGSCRWAYVNASNQVVALAATAATANLANVTSATTVYNLNDANSVLAANGTAFAVQDNNVTSRSTTLGGFTLTTNGITHIRGDAAAGTTRSFVGATGAGGIVVGGGNELVVAGRNNVTLSVPVLNGIAGNSHLTYAGGGTLRMDTAASTYSGQTTVNSGTVRIGTGGSINSSSGIKVNGGRFVQANTTTSVTPALTLQSGTLDGTGTISSVSVSDLAANVVTNGDGTTTALTAGDLTFNGDATIDLRTTGSAGLAVTGTLATTPANGTITLNVPTANTWINGSSYPLISYGSWSGSISDFSLGTVAGLSARQSAALATSGPLNGSVNLVISGDSAVWTGGVNGKWTTTPVGSPFNWKLQTANTGTEFIAGDDVIFDNSSSVTTVDIPDADVTPNTVTFNNNSPTNYTLTGAFGIAGGSLTKNGSGSVTLSTFNTYPGATTINGGTVELSGGGAIADTGLVSLANTAGASLLVSSNETIGRLAGGGASGGSVAIASSTTLTLASGTATFSGTISGDADLVVAGAAQTLGGSGNSYTGATFVDSGALVAATNDALGTTATGTTVGSVAALGLTGGITYSTLEPVSGSGAGTVAANVGPLLAGSRGFVQSVSGNNSFAGPIEINATGISRFGTQDGARLTLNGPITPATGVTGIIVLFRAGASNDDFITLSNNNNSWDGETRIFTTNAGTGAGLRLGIDNGLPAATTLVAGGGTSGTGNTFDLNGFDQTLNGLVNSNGTLHILNSDVANVSTLTLNPTSNRSNYTIAASLTVIEDGAGKVNLVKEGSFTQTLHDPHTYSGSTTINGGSLQLGSFAANPKTGSIPNTTSMTIAAGANFDASLLTSYAIPASMPVTLKLDGTASGSAGKIKAAALDITTADVTFDVVAPLDDAVYILADYTSLTGASFASVTGLPAGYSINYAYNGGTQIALVAPGYSSWLALYPGLGDTTIGGDSDFDGMVNLLEYTLNGNPLLSDTEILPDLDASGADFVFSFTRRTDSANDTTQIFQYSSDLGSWTPVAITGTPGSEVAFGTPAGGLQSVTVTVPKSLAVDGKLFGRLNVTQP